ncbi:Protein CBG04995 [Caenorhabditis briggsae]|uniref:Protein CBG04995 n=1 Tax=Caenorhabditis briggsae TaxID=6238 RepID=A8WYY2_CAEBR|nr:Protein CBG04995 [Caenorhabditis briggsae]CAP25590.2 Protein CBG04995 [Caenorhabditis briggsae]
MIIKLSNVKSDQESIFELIAHLKNLNLQRNRQIQEFRFDGDPTVEELLNVSTPISFRIKPEKYEMDNIEWGNLVALTTIGYMKKLNFMNILELKDRVLVVQNAFSDFDMFSHAFRALEAKKAEISYLGNSEIFMKMEPVIYESLEKSIKCKLPGRLGELKITTEEFLLLASIFFCNPAISKLSDSGKITIISTLRVCYSITLSVIRIMAHADLRVYYCFIHRSRKLMKKLDIIISCAKLESGLCRSKSSMIMRCFNFNLFSFN